MNQRFALALLGKMGHSVVLAENGQEAVDKWRATLLNLPTALPFDICLMDLSMPVCLSIPFLFLDFLSKLVKKLDAFIN